LLPLTARWSWIVALDSHTIFDTKTTVRNNAPGNCRKFPDFNVSVATCAGFNISADFDVLLDIDFSVGDYVTTDPCIFADSNLIATIAPFSDLNISANSNVLLDIDFSIGDD